MSISIFKISLIIVAIGISWAAIEFSDNPKTVSVLELDIAQTKSLDVLLNGNDIGFYKITLPDLGDAVFIQILNSQNSIIDDKKIETKSAVNYFDFTHRGTYTIKITNLSEHSILTEIEFGQTNVEELRIPGIMILAGSLTMTIIAFRKLSHYKMAQPDENTS